MSEIINEITEVVQIEEVLEKYKKYKIYIIDNTSRMHTIRVGDGLNLISNGVTYLITHNNALDFHDVFLNMLTNLEVFSFKNETYSMIFKTKDLVGIQIIPEDY